MKKKVYEHIIEDHETGEIISSITKYQREMETGFVKMYPKGVEFIRTESMLVPVLSLLLERMSYAGSIDGDLVVNLNASIRKDMADKCGIKLNTVAKTLTKLIDADCIKRLAPNKYQINPFYFGKGGWDDIVKARDRYYDEK